MDKAWVSIILQMSRMEMQYDASNDFHSHKLVSLAKIMATVSICEAHALDFVVPSAILLSVFVKRA